MRLYNDNNNDNNNKSRPIHNPCSYNKSIIIKFVALPIYGVVDDVIFDALVFHFISDNMVVETGLPGEIRIDFSGFDGANSFVLINDCTQCSGFPFL